MSKRASVLVTWFAGFVLSLITASPATAQGKWVRLPDFPEPKEELLGATAGGKMYVFAGLGPNFTPMGFVYEYDPASNQWTKKKPMALPSHHVGITEYHGKIYAFGGFVLPQSGPPAWVPINNSWEYDPEADSWKALAPMPTKRGSPVAAAVNDKIYVIGGIAPPPGSKQEGLTGGRPQSSVGTVEEYDPATNTWRERSPMPTPRNHAAVGVVNDKIYVIGGRVGAAFVGPSTNIGTVEEYDPASDQWSAPRAKMITPRSAAASAVYDGRIYVAGGEYQDSKLAAAYRAVEAYDPATNTWTEMPPMPTQRHGLAAGVIGNRLYLISGNVQSGGGGVDVSSPEADAFEFALSK
jgi:N-acetylneuraminic acid mutarotase